MNPERWRQISELVNELVETDALQAKRVLAERGAGDSSLRVEVERLLRDDARAGALFAHGALSFSEPEPVIAGSRIGAYRVVREIGRGGMAIVYLAEREDGYHKYAMPPDGVDVVQGCP
jgi:eukaryotic-like serine/threonine-protein kinase